MTKREIWYVIDLYGGEELDSYDSADEANKAAAEWTEKTGHTTAVALGKFWHQGDDAVHQNGDMK